MKVPRQLILEPNNSCNLRCIGCPSNGVEDRGNMDLDLFRYLVDTAVKEFPDTVIVAWGYGEPLMYPRYLEMCRYLNEKGRKWYITTNGTIWKEEVFREAFRQGSGCYQLVVSIDGMFGTGTVAKTRPGSSENIVKENIGRIIDLHRELGSKTDLAIKICERGQDYAEREQFIQFWLANPEIAYVCDGKLLEGENEESMRVYPCQYFDHNFMFVRYDGTLVPCTYNPHVLNDGALCYGKMSIGDSLIEAYNNPFLVKLRDDQNRGIFRSPCDKCKISYTGMGQTGTTEFRNNPGVRYFKSGDYYNTFYSKEQRWKPNSFYGADPKGE